MFWRYFFLHCDFFQWNLSVIFLSNILLVLFQNIVFFQSCLLVFLLYNVLYILTYSNLLFQFFLRYFFLRFDFWLNISVSSLAKFLLVLLSLIKLPPSNFPFVQYFVGTTLCLANYWPRFCSHAVSCKELNIPPTKKLISMLNYHIKNCEQLKQQK